MWRVRNKNTPACLPSWCRPGRGTMSNILSLSHSSSPCDSCGVSVHNVPHEGPQQVTKQNQIRSASQSRPWKSLRVFFSRFIVKEKNVAPVCGIRLYTSVFFLWGIEFVLFLSVGNHFGSTEEFVDGFFVINVTYKRISTCMIIKGFFTQSAWQNPTQYAPVIPSSITSHTITLNFANLHVTNKVLFTRSGSIGDELGPREL